jgi:hypothetical protein
VGICQRGKLITHYHRGKNIGILIYPQIFPTRLRAYGVGLAAATQWLFNFVITEITPRAVNHIGWRTFLMFGIFCLAMGVFAFFFIKETKGRSLEDMDVLFGTVDQVQRNADVEQVLGKTRVAHMEDAEEEEEEAQRNNSTAAKETRAETQ